MSIDIVISLLGGLAMFLFGMRVMGDGLERAAGPKLKHFLGAMTKNKFIAMLTGLCVTAIIQSSGATTVMLVGFVNAQLLTLAQAVGVIMGANIGTTVTAFLLSIPFDPGAIFAFVGILLIMLSGKRDTLRETGYVFMGLGILFVGMHLMSDSMTPLRDWPVFQELMLGVKNPFLGVLLGLGVTALLQSSSVSVGIMQVLAMSGLVTMDAALYFLLGANIGSCLPSLLAMANSSIAAKRTAIIHLLFNVVGTIMVLLVTPFLPLAAWAEQLIPGNAKLCIAFMHISFNTICTILLLPLSGLLVKLSALIIRGEDAVPTVPTLQFYDERLLMTPAIAAQQLYREACRMGRESRNHIHLAIGEMDGTLTDQQEEIERLEALSDYLEEKITEGLVAVMAEDLTDVQTKQIGNLFHVVNDLERISDHALNIHELTAERLGKDIPLSDKALDELRDLSGRVQRMVDVALEGLEEWDISNDVMALMEQEEQKVDDLTETLRKRHIERLKEHKCTPRSGVIFLETINNLERVADHAMNIAASAREAGVIHTAIR